MAGLALTFAGSLTACADGEAAERLSDDLDVVDEAAPAATLAAMTPAAGTAAADQQIFDQTNALVCDTDRKTLETAIDAFYAMEGRAPTDETELVGTLLREASASYDIAPDGTLIPAPGSPCT